MKEVESFDQLRDELMRRYEAGDYAAALGLVESNELKFPDMSAHTTFWKMCLHSLKGNKDDALSIFRKGLNGGLWWAEVVFDDTDLDPLRDLTEFKALVAESKKRWEQEKAEIEREHVLLFPGASVKEPYPLLVVLHGRNGNKESNLEHWEFARGMGWAILSPQSTQPLFPGSYCWDDPTAGIQDILFHLENTLKAHGIDRERIVIGGFSQGSGMAIYAALHPETQASGFIGVGTWWADVDSIASLAEYQKQVRGYFISGKSDHTLERSREIQAALKANNISLKEEIHTNLGHEFPSNFSKSLQQALEFILEE